MLSALSHIITYCKKGEKKSTEIDEVVKGCASIVSQDVIFAQKSNNGLGLQ